MKYPKILLPNTSETWTIDGKAYQIPKCTIQLDEWKGELVNETFGGKPIVEFNCKPMFAEIALMNMIIQSGWDARWIETYGQPKNDPLYLMEWADDKLSQQRHSPILDTRITTKLRDISIDNNASFYGCWDILAWKDEQILFAEAKRNKKDRIRQTQKKWFLSGLRIGMLIDNFMLIEWDFDLNS